MLPGAWSRSCLTQTARQSFAVPDIRFQPRDIHGHGRGRLATTAVRLRLPSGMNRCGAPHAERVASGFARMMPQRTGPRQGSAATRNRTPRPGPSQRPGRRRRPRPLATPADVEQRVDQRPVPSSRTADSAASGGCPCGACPRTAAPGRWSRRARTASGPSVIGGMPPACRSAVAGLVGPRRSHERIRACLFVSTWKVCCWLGHGRNISGDEAVRHGSWNRSDMLFDEYPARPCPVARNVKPVRPQAHHRIPARNGDLGRRAISRRRFPHSSGHSLAETFVQPVTQFHVAWLHSIFVLVAHGYITSSCCNSSAG